MVALSFMCGGNQRTQECGGNQRTQECGGNQRTQSVEETRELPENLDMPQIKDKLFLSQ